MPVTNVQANILCLLASRRDPNRNAPRYSGDIDVFHDREERVARAAAEDGALLEKEGYTLEWRRRDATIYSVLARRANEATKLEWVVDSDFRFFPAVRDEEFGYVLHPADLATNKVAAAYGRREPRDIVDLITIHDTFLPIGAAVWAAAGKALGFTPEGIIDEIRRNSRYTAEDFHRIHSDPPIDLAATMIRLREILTEAEAFVARMPTEKVGLLFLKSDKVVQPDPDKLDEYQTHAGQRRGHWPSSPEITAAMFERAAQNRENPPRNS